MSSNTKYYGDEFVFLDTDGSVYIPSGVMGNYVHETKGCSFFWEDMNKRLALKLLRQVDDPPNVIERLVDRDDFKGMVNAATYLKSVGYALPSSMKQCPCRYYSRFHMLEIILEPDEKAAPRKTTSILGDDFPAL